MTRSTLHSDKAAAHQSFAWFDSEACPGVRFRVARISLERRIELARRIREIGRKLEFLEAGSDPREKLEAAVLESEMDRAYLEWGLEAIEGLEIDGEAATPAALIERGPLKLALEIAERIRAECSLNQAERKN
jgi:hypothetical protein